MAHNPLTDITIAVAGMLQAIALIRDIAETGYVDEAAYTATLQSLFIFDAEKTETVFGGLQGVEVGLEKILQSFSQTATVDPLQQRYLLSLIHLQKKVMRSPALMQTLNKRLQQTQKQVAYFSLTHPTVISNLADTYLETIRTFKFRLMIVSTQRIMQQPDTMEKVRALLLAGVRAAVLWRQVGGSRLQLLFSRSSIKTTAEKILQQLESPSFAHKEYV